MATRSGSVDPGMLLWLITDVGNSAESLARVPDHGSGLAGLSGGTGDMRDVLDAREADGVGEHARELRAVTSGRLAFLGVSVDPQRNTAPPGDTDIRAAGAGGHAGHRGARRPRDRQTRAVLAR